VAAGAQQQIDLLIDALQGQESSLILVVTYPNGEVTRSVHYLTHGGGTIAWEIPANVGVGEATFRLSLNGCTCGAQNTIPRQSTVEGTIDGTFLIHIAQPPPSD